MPKNAIIRSDDLRGENRRRVLDTLRIDGPCTPSRLSLLTSLSAASISTLSSQMVDQGILGSERLQRAGDKPLRGRPRSLLSLRQDAGHVLTLTLTIDLIRAHLVNYAGTVCASHRQIADTRRMSKEQLLATICQCIDELRQQNPTTPLLHIGVGFQGQTEFATGKLLWSPIIGERNIPLGETLQHRYQVSVSVHNDCYLISQALSRQQRTVLGDTFATVLFGHGIGLGLHLNGQAFAGTRSSALKMGHLRFQNNGALCRCGKRGCIEAYAANYGIERLAKDQPLNTPPSGRVANASLQALLEAAESGQESACQAFRTAGMAIGEGLSNVFTLLDPLPVALVGCSSRTFALIRGSISSTLDTHLVDGPTADSLLHYFEHNDALLMQGLADNSLSTVDRQLANQGSTAKVSP